MINEVTFLWILETLHNPFCERKRTKSHIVSIRVRDAHRGSPIPTHCRFQGHRTTQTKPLLCDMKASSRNISYSCILHPGGSLSK